MKRMLADVRPELINEWSQRNLPLTPDSVTHGSHKIVWWIGKCGHEWRASVKNRVIGGSGCPYCSHNATLVGFNDLASQKPELAAEWSDRNAPLLPTQVTVFANRKAWWKCRECGNEWETLITTRSDGSKCPYCSVVAEDDGLFYMFQADITYVDEALYENKLSVVFDDLPAARETLDRVREFVSKHPTVYMGTHTPQGYENLEAKLVMDLDNPVETVLAEVDFTEQEATGIYVCSICGYVYDPAENDGVAFEDLPDVWRCPRCKQPKEKFNKA